MPFPRLLLGALALLAPLFLSSCYGESYCPVYAASGGSTCDYGYHVCDVADAPDADHDVLCDTVGGAFTCECRVDGQVTGTCDTDAICAATYPEFDYVAMTDAVNACCGWAIDGSVFE